MITPTPIVSAPALVPVPAAQDPEIEFPFLLWQLRKLDHSQGFWLCRGPEHLLSKVDAALLPPSPTNQQVFDLLVRDTKRWRRHTVLDFEHDSPRLYDRRYDAEREEYLMRDVYAVPSYLVSYLDCLTESRPTPPADYYQLCWSREGWDYTAWRGVLERYNHWRHRSLRSAARHMARVCARGLEEAWDCAPRSWRNLALLRVVRYRYAPHHDRHEGHDSNWTPEQLGASERQQLADLLAAAREDDNREQG